MPVRAAPVLAATVNVTLAGPVPLLPVLMVSQELLLVAVQVQPDPVFTLTLPFPPAAAKF